MAKVIAIGQPVNDSEREAIAYLRDHLPNTFTVIHNFELKQGREIYEIDIALLGPHCVHVVDVKGTRGHVDVYGGKWYPEGRAPYQSPLALLRRHAKALKTLICDRYPTNRSLGRLYVDAAVLMTAADAFVQDPGGQDGPAVAYLRKCAAFFQATTRIPQGRSTDIRAQFRPVHQAIVGGAAPRKAPPCFGTWQVEERLGGTDRYTEYRARHTLLGAKRGGTARLRVYPVDPYLPEDERERERRRIENAYRAVSALPGHPNILTVREFFPTEAEDGFVLVTADVAGHALRQHVKKSSLALTFDQKIAVVRDVLAALDHAHRSDPQVLHRNLTPDAVIVAASGRALLCGFDHARAGRNRTTTIGGDVIDELDPMCQAPECYRDVSQASVASDLYAAGLVFYEALVGEPAWTSVDDMMEKDGVFPVKPSEQKPELPPAFDEWLQGLCAFDVETRPSSAAVALARFNAIIGPDPRAGGRAAVPDPAPAPVQRPEVDYAVLQRGDDVANRFRIEERLGQGGFAVVYRAFDAFSDTSRVLKIIVKDRRSTFERLKREYSLLEQLPPHPNIVRVVWADKLQRDDTPYLVFEYVPGTGVNELLDTGALSPDDARRIAADTLVGLDHLHRHGVFHRDIKPSNLLWTDRGVRIIDFNVAVRQEDDEARPGGTRRYMPPDLDFTDEMTTAEKVDWDLFSLGVTLYECVTGKYPWKADTPIAGEAPTDPSDHVSALTPAFTQVLLRATAPRRADRFASATAFRDALAEIPSVHLPPPPPIAEPRESVDAALLQPHKPNFNPFVSHLLRTYSQSPRSNAGTRGLDEIGRETYVRTLLDDGLRPALLAGEFRLVAVTGNAGDGKTAFIQQIERATEVAPTLVTRPNGAEFTLAGRRFITNHDGSQDEGEKLNDDVLRAFFRPFEGDQSSGWPQDETRIIAINEGRLVDFLTEHEDRFRRLRALVVAGLAGAAATDGVAAVNLNLRSVTADPPGAGPSDTIFDRLVRRLTAERFWAPCAGCDIRDRCYAHHNARTLVDPVAGRRVVDRLRALHAITHFRGRLHVTMRDLRSALAFMLTGARDCDQIHAQYASAGADAREQILDGFYFNAWQGGGAGDRLLARLRQIDVGEATNPELDRALGYLPPAAGDAARFAFEGRGGYDTQLLERLHRELPREWPTDAGAAAAGRMTVHRRYLAMLRRREFFERRDEQWKEMLPYRSYDEFSRLVAGQVEPGLYRDKLIMGINRGEGLGDPRRLGVALALRVRVVDRGTVQSYRLFPGAHFRLLRPGDSEHHFVEHVPQALRLVHEPPGGAPAELIVDLDTYEMLTRLGDGYRPSLEERQGHYLPLAVFKNVLSSAPYQEVLLTRTGHDYFRIERGEEGILSIEALTGETG